MESASAGFRSSNSRKRRSCSREKARFGSANLNEAIIASVCFSNRWLFVLKFRKRHKF
jgi:hypothetical protein